MSDKEREIKDMLQKLQFGTKIDKTDALLGLSTLTISSGSSFEANLKEEIHNHLYSIVTGQTETNLQDACFAAMTLAQLGYVSQYVAYPLLTFLQYYAEDPVKFSGPMDELMNSYNLICFAIHATYALSLFKGNRDVLNELVDVVKNCLNTQLDDIRIKNLISACIRSIGAIGKSEDNNAKTILEQFSNQGNITAKAALELFGSSWDEIKNKEIKLEEKYESKDKSEINLKSSSEILAKIMNLCEDNPDTGLELINNMWNNSQRESNLGLKWAKFLAYGSKGLFLHVKKLNLKDEELDDISLWEGREYREKLNLNDNHLDYLERALIEVKEIENIDPNLIDKVGTEEEPVVKAKVDAVAIVLERCRPGRVQELLSKTKLQYFGAERIGYAPFDFFTQKPIEKNNGELRVFLDSFFEFPSIVKSALIVHKGIENDGCKSIWIQLFRKAFDEFGPEETFGDVRMRSNLYDVILYDDGTFKISPECKKKEFKQIFCTNCGQELKEGAKFCTNCGEEV